MAAHRPRSILSCGADYHNRKSDWRGGGRGGTLASNSSFLIPRSSFFFFHGPMKHGEQEMKNEE
jgi:hypothetical protein